MDKHKDVIDHGESQVLLHPLMRLFSELKWKKHQMKYGFNMGVFTLFLICLTLHGFHYIEMMKCGQDSKYTQVWKNATENETCPIESGLSTCNCTLYCPPKYLVWRYYNQHRYHDNLERNDTDIYLSTVIECMEDRPPEVDGVRPPVDTTQPNPNEVQNSP